MCGLMTTASPHQRLPETSNPAAFSTACKRAFWQVFWRKTLVPFRYECFFVYINPAQLQHSAIQNNPVMNQQFFRNQASITSLSGCGSSSLLADLKHFYRKAPYRFPSGGDIMRAVADRRGVSIETLARQNRENPEWGIDHELDQMLNIFGTQDYVICEGRLPHIMMPGAFKVRLRCPREECARRIATRDGILEAESMRRIIERDDENDGPRYRDLYGQNCLWEDDSGFDLVINTQEKDRAATVEAFLAGHAAWVAEKGAAGQLVSAVFHPEFALDVKALRFE